MPCKAYLKEARAMVRKMWREHATVSIDSSLSAAVQLHRQAAVVSVTFSGFGRTQAITAPPNAVPQFSRG